MRNRLKSLQWSRLHFFVSAHFVLFFQLSASLDVLSRWIESLLRGEWMEIKLLHNVWAVLPSTRQSGKCCIKTIKCSSSVRRRSQSKEKAASRRKKKESWGRKKTQRRYTVGQIIDALRKQAATSPHLSAALLLKHCKSQSKKECLAASLGNATLGPSAVTAWRLEFCHREFNGEELAHGDMLFSLLMDDRLWEAKPKLAALVYTLPSSHPLAIILCHCSLWNSSNFQSLSPFLTAPYIFPLPSSFQKLCLSPHCAYSWINNRLSVVKAPHPTKGMLFPILHLTMVTGNLLRIIFYTNVNMGRNISKANQQQFLIWLSVISIPRLFYLGKMNYEKAKCICRVALPVIYWHNCQQWKLIQLNYFHESAILLICFEHPPL